MDSFLNLILISFLFLAAIIVLYILNRDFFPYHKKKRFLSEARQKFFRSLEQAIGESYYIFPEVRLASLLEIDKEVRSDWHKYFYKIAQKSVDFVLCDKQTISPVLIIELEESQDKTLRRTRRDEFIKKALEAAKLPLLVVQAQEAYNAEELKITIQSAITSK